MSKQCCSVYGCSNSYKNNVGVDPPFHLYSFPSRPWERERRRIWIRFANRKNFDGSDWVPSKRSGICCRHFVNNEKSENPKSASYNPTIYILKETKMNTNYSDKNKGNARINGVQKEEAGNLECFVKGCGSSYTTRKQIPTFFYPPKDPVMFERWKRLLPESDDMLSPTCRVCELHFEDRFFIPDLERRIDGKETVPSRERLKLSANALPTIFPNTSECPRRLLQLKPRGDETLREDEDVRVLVTNDNTADPFAFLDTVQLPTRFWSKHFAQNSTDVVFSTCLFAAACDVPLVDKAAVVKRVPEAKLRANLIVNGKVWKRDIALSKKTDLERLLNEFDAEIPCPGLGIRNGWLPLTEEIKRQVFRFGEGVFSSECDLIVGNGNACLKCDDLKKNIGQLGLFI